MVRGRLEMIIWLSTLRFRPQSMVGDPVGLVEVPSFLSRTFLSRDMLWLSRILPVFWLQTGQASFVPLASYRRMEVRCIIPMSFIRALLRTCSVD